MSQTMIHLRARLRVSLRRHRPSRPTGTPPIALLALIVALAASSNCQSMVGDVNVGRDIEQVKGR